MSFFKEVSKACLGVALFARFASAQEAWEPEPKLEFLPTTAPGLIGFLGDPQLGAQFQNWRIVWNAGGHLLTSGYGSVFERDLIHVWTPPTATELPRCKGPLNAGPPWAIANRGDLLCAKVLPSDKIGARDYPAAYQENSVHCFSLADSKKRWSFTLEGDRNHQIDALCFSKDDSHVLFVCLNRNECTLHLVDAATGQEKGRLPLPEPEARIHSPNTGKSIVPSGSGFIMVRKTEDGNGLLLNVRTDPLQVETIPCDQAHAGNSRALCLSRDERTLAVYGSEGYHVLCYRGNQWQPSISGNVEPGDYGDILQGATLSSDGKWLVVATNRRTQVIDLIAERAVKKTEDGWMGAAFSPKDDVVLVAEHSGLGCMDPNTWTTRPAPAAQHDCPVDHLIALPDQRTIIAHDHNALIVWDAAARKPRAILKSKRTKPCMGVPVLANNNREIIAADGWDFLRWELPNLAGPPPVHPSVIVGKPAFGTVPSQREEAEPMAVFGNGAGTRFVTMRGNKGELRDLSSPSTVKTLTALSGISIFDVDMVFVDDTQVSIFDGSGVTQVLNLTTDQLNPVAGTKREGPRHGLWLPGKTLYVTTGKQLQFVDAATGKVVRTFASPDKDLTFSGGNDQGIGAAVSTDGKLAAARLGTFSGQMHLGLWDLQSGNLLALQKLPNLDALCLAFTGNGRAVAIGHGNATISLWNVGALLEKGMGETKALPQQEPKKGAVRSSSRKAYESVAADPKSPLDDGRGNRWTFRSDGSCAVESRLPSFGRLTINGQAMTTKAVRYIKRSEQETLGRGTSLAHDGVVESEHVWISRSLSHHFNMESNVVQSVDAFTNTGDRPARIEIAFEIQFPADTKGLLSTGSRNLPIPADGRLTLSKEDHWVAPAGSGKPGASVAVARISNWTNPTPPSLRWDSGTQTLCLTYGVTIPPSESRWLVHGVAMVDRSAEGSVNLVNLPQETDVGFLVLPGSQAQAINFGRPDLSKIIGPLMPLPSSMTWSNQDAKAMPDRDPLGFAWEVRHDFSRAGELGAVAVHELWLNGVPPAFTAATLLRSHHDGQIVMPRSVMLGAHHAKISVNREVHGSADGGPTLWLDIFTNFGAETEEIRASYVTTFGSPVVAVWDALGKKHTMSEIADAGLTLGGACAFVLEGEQQPATLIAFYKDGAQIAPTLRAIGSRAVALDYVVQIKPHMGTTLLHGACQRPLTAFGGAKPAFADWLPLNAPIPKTYTVKKLANPSSAAKRRLPILNYDPPTSL